MDLHIIQMRGDKLRLLTIAFPSLETENSRHMPMLGNIKIVDRRWGFEHALGAAQV